MYFKIIYKYLYYFHFLRRKFFPLMRILTVFHKVSFFHFLEISVVATPEEEFHCLLLSLLTFLSDSPDVSLKSFGFLVPNCVLAAIWEVFILWRYCRTHLWTGVHDSTSFKILFIYRMWVLTAYISWDCCEDSLC